MTMLKNYFLSLLLVNFTLYSTNKNVNNNSPKVNIEILNIKTNGLVLSNNTFSFNGVDELIIEFDVKTSYTGSNINYNQGISASSYFEPNSFNNEDAEYYNNGVESHHLFQKSIKLEFNNATYSYTYRQKLRFKRSTIYNTGSSIIFTYRVPNIKTIITNKLTYKIIGGTKTENEPYKPSTANLSINNISYSNGLSIANNTIVVPDYEGDEIGTRTIDLSFNFNCTYGSELKLGYYPSATIHIADNNISDKTTLSEWTPTNTTNGTLTFNNLKIKSSDLTPSSYLMIRFRFQEVDINFNCAIIKSSRPILYNTISDNQSISLGNYSKPLIGTVAKRSLMPTGTRVTEDITNYQWQQKTEKNDWMNIIGATLQNYTPINKFLETTSFRRIAKSNDGLHHISEYISISTVPPPANTICCDQKLTSAASQPAPFTGNILNPAFSYQWQMKNNSPWENITGATDSNRTYIFPVEGGRDQQGAQFRRLIIQNNAIIGVSNIISITGRIGTPGATVGRRTLRLTVNEENSKETPNNIHLQDIENNTYTTETNLSIYPNPITNNFYIQNTNKFKNPEKVKLFDTSGNEIKINKSVISDNLIEITIYSAPPGIYIVHINEGALITKKIIKN